MFSQQQKTAGRPRTGTQPKVIFTRIADFDAYCIQIATYLIILAYLFNYNSLLPIAYCLFVACCLLRIAPWRQARL